ncbi:MAG TPA: DUF2188 domain-containing protein [Solirubrobacterales bacterium]|jgi:hypothetical protein|nr:DUF2188 domain-containing protein [Solirubrobacterales bacterium]
MQSTRYVKKARGRGWDVVKEGHRRATAHGATKADAIDRARELVRLEGGGEVQVLDRSGKTVDISKIRAPKRRAVAA